jgi:hypothetical protein
MSRAAELVAEIIDATEDRPYGTGRPPLSTINVVETLRFLCPRGHAVAGAAGRGRARFGLHPAPPGRLERYGAAAQGPRRPGPDGALGTRGRLGCRGRQLLGPRQTRRRADRPQSHRPRQGRDQVQSRIREVGAPHGSGLGAVRCVVEHDCAWLLASKRLDRRHDRLGRVILSLLTTACIFVVANRINPF